MTAKTFASTLSNGIKIQIHSFKWRNDPKLNHNNFNKDNHRESHPGKSDL